LPCRPDWYFLVDAKTEHDGQRIVLKQAPLSPDGVEVREAPLSDGLR
jgi:hypothetical protein